MADWAKIVVQILSGLCVCVPLVFKLYASTKAAIREKNWGQIVAAVLDLMQEAEGKFQEGEAKKVWVMAGVESVAKSINYDYDDVAKRQVADMIDAICEASKILNATAEKE